MGVDAVAPCYGRDNQIRRLLELAGECGCVLLFGGRRAGKTTMLRFAERVSVDGLRQSARYADEPLAVYVNLMALPYDAGPRELYRFLVNRAAEVCADIADSGDLSVAESAGRLRGIDTTDAFVDELDRLLRATRGVRRVILLLDEAGRVLGRRFGRAFQDNLFSMLYVDGSEASQRVSLVFGGAQELAGFCEDETSPLGSRAGQLDIVNLEFSSFSEFAQDRAPTIDERLRRELFEESGGHAGLSALLIERCAGRTSLGEDDVQDVCQQVADRSRRLFEHWMAHFSEDARVILKRFATQHVGLRRRQVGQLLEDEGRDRFGAERTWHELQYVGVCRVDDKGFLVRCNDLFWRYYREFEPGEVVGTADERRVWDLIRETELSLRDLVYRKYGEKWPGREVSMMKKILGKEWNKIEEVKQKADAAYPLSPDRRKEVMDCMYLGQLGALVESNQAWDLFKELFLEKPEFKRRMRDIFPVRNDIAHFAPAVPQKELLRCGIACHDILVIVKQTVDDW